MYGLQVRDSRAAGLGDEVDGSEAEGLQRHLGAVPSEAGKHHHGDGVARQQAAEDLQAVELGHFDVKGYDIRLQLVGKFQCLLTIECLPHHLQVRLGTQHASDYQPHIGGVINYENANRLVHGSGDGSNRSVNITLVVGRRGVEVEGQAPAG